MRRRIRKAEIKFVSLVPKGANRLAPIYKADGTFEIFALTKAADDFDETGELLNVVYPVELRDTQGDIADAEVVKAMAYGFIPNGAAVDLNHDGKPLPREQAHVAENFLVQKTDTRFHGWRDDQNKDVDLTGAWATVIKIHDPEIRKRYRSGEWAGVSMGGTALVEAEKSDPPNPPEPETKTMDETKILKAITDGFAGMTAELTKALAPKTPETPKPETKPDELKAPVFKGDRRDPRAVQLHGRALEAYELEKATNWEDPQSVRSYREALQELQKTWKDEDEEAGVEETKPVTKGTRPTTAPARKVATESLEDLAKSGRELAEQINQSRGFAASK
jgi:hypothetical protein